MKAIGATKQMDDIKASAILQEGGHYFRSIEQRMSFEPMTAGDYFLSKHYGPLTTKAKYCIYNLFRIQGKSLCEPSNASTISIRSKMRDISHKKVNPLLKCHLKTRFILFGEVRQKNQ